MKYYEGEEEFSQEEESEEDQGYGGQEERKVGSQGKPESPLQAFTQSSGITKSKTLGEDFMIKSGGLIKAAGGSGSESTQNQTLKGATGGKATLSSGEGESSQNEETKSSI
jgi:hypothetical protein